MTPLSTADAFFLWMEGRRCPMHVAALSLYSVPDGLERDFARQAAEQLRSVIRPRTSFTRYPVQRLGRWYWTEDQDFDVDHHLRRSALPQPGRVRELLELVSRLHGALQDRRRPPWEMHLIEGLNDGRLATYLKLHHAMTDGIGAVRVITGSHSADPQGALRSPAWDQPATAEAASGATDPRARDPLDELYRAFKNGSETSRGVARALHDLLRRSRPDPADIAPFQAPACRLNTRITGSRRFAAQAWPLSRLKALARKAEVTLNDIVLSVCAAALRQYLLDLQALPERSLIAMVPMSVRSAADIGAGGNQVAMLLVDLATDEVDPLRRLSRIAASSRCAKERLRQMTPAEQFGYTLASGLPLPLSVATGSYRRRPPFNVVISNVPGPTEPLYWNGACLESLFPMSIAFDGQALNISLVSYCDQLCFGFLGCRSTAPHLQRLLEHTDRAIAHLEAAVYLHAPRNDRQSRPLALTPA